MQPQPHHYTLLDFGHGRKLEQFGAYTLIRPEPKATGSAHLNREKWEALAHAEFIPRSGSQRGKTRGGQWKQFKPLPDSWEVNFPVGNKSMKFRVAPSPFGHVGLFPEQYENWQFIAQQLEQQTHPAPKVLNLFAYTGAASVVARAFGAEVYHVDSSRPVLNQARSNMELNNLSDIRWVHEDAFKFAQREAKRGHQYSGIILDPPPAGRGRSGERWSLKDQFDELLQSCAQIVSPTGSFISLSLYATDWSISDAEQYVKQHFSRKSIISNNYLLKPEHGAQFLAQGFCIRIIR